jgi:3-deoxy-D-manno-octulosonic-acid transferase
MRTIYRISTVLYFFAIKLASPFYSKASKMIRGRKQSRYQIEKLDSHIAKCIWFHCASLGEFEQGRPLIERIRENYPQKRIVLTFFSPSGYEMRKDYAVVNEVYYMPFDTPQNAKFFINRINPGMAIFVKYEFWYFHLNYLHEKKVPTYLISAIFRPSQWMFNYGKKLAIDILKNFEYIFAQNAESEQLVKQLGIDAISAIGDTRSERVIDIVNEDFSDPLLDAFSKNNKLLIGGSTWPKDEALLFDFFYNQTTDYKLLLVPHEITENHLTQIEKQSNGIALRYSKAKVEEMPACKILMLDTMGMLSKVYRYGNVAYIGGGFGKGIHNTLEAAAYGIPVFFGPKHYKFAEASALINCGGGFCVNRSKQLMDVLDNFNKNTDLFVASGKAAKNYVFSSKGILSAIYDKMQEHFEKT